MRVLLRRAHRRGISSAWRTKRGINPRGLEQRITVVPQSEQQREIDSDFYHGGCVYHDDASVDPMKLLLGLLDRARRAGAAVLDGMRGVRPSDARATGFEVLTSRGMVQGAQGADCDERIFGPAVRRGTAAG